MTQLKNQRIILTGATGGIGIELAKQLITHDCKLGMVGRSLEKLEQLAGQLSNNSDDITLIVADIITQQGRQTIIDKMEESFSGYDILLNTAGIMDFTSLLEQSDERIEAVFQTNVIAPMQLCKKVLPYMKLQNKGHIVNVGSVFGSIGFAWFTSYSTSKFALRGFSQALRRELAETPVKVSYIAPRAVKTSLNSSAVYAMAKEVKMNMDSPDWVAKQIIHSIIKNKKEKYLGFPESLFVRINAIFSGNC
ncbi:MAG: SDR family oxidoreductase [gamma proteobacterium symbiont of Bathyaustriella thionipta]|nr:SDR family oxidoreductase [gamma proteobacterium symbiont of Bathyaustriella thionipta]MCU7950537.1 SDR family oxidoreductase [gamma proteobacterium symbiont of Bathyaustriella thionipta]MCU7951851.1 SDR family oxidoreductase [gamma proteobacterium symbiont of Bathyaustriella thionipta]MCU7957031.1 SDR family oxidoreductase [gamma proteobacterium symbiont of Bathyaustriella thionipta]MCU7968859.1 SDR family oxidoreductase [gamma proteobacterium symbiont of Bathyaustriella thionipta]